MRDRRQAPSTEPPAHQRLAANARLSPWAWVRRALAVAVQLIVVGWLLGAAVGMWSPIVGRVLATICVGLGGTAWAVGQIGGAGLFAGLMGLLAVVGMSIEAGHAQVVRNVDTVELSSLADWQPGGPVLAAHVGYLEHLQHLEVGFRHWQGSGKTRSSVYEVATPLLDRARGSVVGFHCHSDTDRNGGGGEWVISSAVWTGASSGSCRHSIALARQNAQDHGHDVAEGADARVVEVFGSEAELRAGHELDKAFGIPIAFFLVLYAPAVLFLRRRGAASVD